MHLIVKWCELLQLNLKKDVLEDRNNHLTHLSTLPSIYHRVHIIFPVYMACRVFPIQLEIDARPSPRPSWTLNCAPAKSSFTDDWEVTLSAILE